MRIFRFGLHRLLRRFIGCVTPLAAFARVRGVSNSLRPRSRSAAMENAGATPQGTAGRKRIPNRERPSVEDEALNLIAREGEARLVAKRAARAEAREIRMKELEKQQKEVEERSAKDFEKGIQTASSLSAANLASLGGTFSRRGSGDISISIDTETSVREIKDSLAEVEEKYKKAMVSNAQLDNEKTNFMYQVETLQDALLELEEQLAESKRQFEEKSKDFEREKHAHAILQFQFMELKEVLKQKEELLAEVRQLQQKQEGFVKEITDLQETIEWKEKKIGQYGIITNFGIVTNGEISDCLTNDGLSNSSKVISETSHAFKVSEDCTEGRANEVEMENEILENMGKRELLQNTEHEENTEDTKDQEIILKCLEIKTFPAGENVEKTEFIEQNEPKSEEVVVEEYHEALDVDEASFGELKTSEKRDDQTNKDNEKVISADEVGSEALVEESDSIQHLKGHTFEEAKFMQIDFSVSETTKSQYGLLEDESKLLDGISSEQIAAYTPEQLENLESAMNESQEETQRYKKSKDSRLKRLLDEREFLLEQIKKLKGQLEEKQNSKIEKLHLEDGVLENGPDMHVIDLQRDANRQISDLKFKLAKSEQEITALEQNVLRLEGQVVRYKTAAENAERIEDELKAEKRKLQRELRSALDKTEELEVSNGHLVKRLEKMKANRSALLSQQ
ncbi:leucine-rich repeat flightless-interacting protein 1 [Crotalus adamanteus]|uniref:Leucine-rich repeat flightless-interacting protein 1 n=1 Tax=Crotalus adamanteus TaxID=8729 RepID=A0AAW1CA59_CROAD